MLSDTEIIDLYWSRAEEAVSETAGRYGRYLNTVAMNIVEYQPDAEECVNDTYLNAWNAMPPQRPEALRTWLGRVTRNLSLDCWRRRHAQKRGGGTDLLLSELEDALPAAGDAQSAMEAAELGALISRFLRGLSLENRVLFVRRYWYAEGVKEMAARYGMGESKIKSSLFRTRNALRAFLAREGVAL